MPLYEDNEVVLEQELGRLKQTVRKILIDNQGELDDLHEVLEQVAEFGITIPASDVAISLVFTANSFPSEWLMKSNRYGEYKIKSQLHSLIERFADAIKREMEQAGAEEVNWDIEAEDI